MCKNNCYNEGIWTWSISTGFKCHNHYTIEDDISISRSFKQSFNWVVCCIQICLGSNLHGSASNITITKIICKNNCALAGQSVICHRTLRDVDSCKNNGLKLKIAKSFRLQNKNNTAIQLLSFSNFYTGFVKQIKYYKCLCWLWYCLIILLITYMSSMVQWWKLWNSKLKIWVQISWEPLNNLFAW